MRDLFLVLFLFVAIYYAFKRPYLGVAAWIWIALTAPANWAWGFSQSFRLNFTIVIVTALAYLITNKQKQFKINALGVWVLLFGFWTLISTIFNLNTDPAFVWSYWYQFVKVLALFLFILLIINKRLHIDTLIWAIVLSISAYAGMEAVKFILSGGGHRITGRAGIIADRNDLAVAINMCIPLVVYLAHVTPHKWLKLGLWGLLMLNVIAVVGTHSRGGFIGLGILAFAFWLSSRHKVILGVLALVLVPVLYQAAPEDWQERQSTISTAVEEDSSFIGRVWAWKISTMIALDNPMTGGGFRAVTVRELWHYYAPLTPSFPPVESPPIPEQVAPKAAHNIFFQVLGDHGFVGLAIFLVCLLLALINNLQNLRWSSKHGALWYRKLCGALNLALIGYSATGANVSLAYFDLLYALIGLVIVMTVHRTILADTSQPMVQKPQNPPPGHLLPARSAKGAGYRLPDAQNNLNARRRF